MNRLALPQVTLVAIDTRAPQLAAQALLRSMAGIEFAQVLLLSHRWTPVQALPGIEVVDCGPIASGADYSHFVLRKLSAFVRSSHVLVTQWDGFVVEPRAWSDEFLAYDYIGAPWPEQPAATAVGNGGFSLRSRRLLGAGLDPRIVAEHPEDVALCRRYRGLLEQAHGVRFAPLALARRFAFENWTAARPTFGFHGPCNLPHVLDETTLASWIEVLPDEYYAGRDARRLARALLGCRMPALVRRVVERRALVGRREPSTCLLGAAARILDLFGLHHGHSRSP